MPMQALRNSLRPERIHPARWALVRGGVLFGAHSGPLFTQLIKRIKHFIDRQRFEINVVDPPIGQLLYEVVVVVESGHDKHSRRIGGRVEAGQEFFSTGFAKAQVDQHYVIGA